MSTPKELAAGFLAAAQQNPGGRNAIFRRAAQVFADLASDPRNRRQAAQLQQMAFDFVSAAREERPATISDFENLLRETATAYEQVGDSTLDQIARAREVHDEQRSTQSVSIAPLSFNRDATLGRSQILKWNPSQEEILQGIKESETVAFWQGTKQEAQAITVDVALVSAPPPAEPSDNGLPPIDVRPYGIVEYGSDGNRTSVRFDVGAGKRFTVVGNYCSVLVGVDPPFEGARTATISIGASIGTFAAPSPCPTTLTRYIDTLAPNVFSPFIAIPLKAVQLLAVQSNLIAGESLTVRFYSFGGGSGVVSQYDFTVAASVPLPPIVPLTGDVAFVKIRHTGGGPRRFRLPFQLSL